MGEPTDVEGLVESIAKLLYEIKPYEDYGEYIDGFQVSPGGPVTWEKALKLHAEFSGTVDYGPWSVIEDARATAAAIAALPALQLLQARARKAEEPTDVGGPAWFAIPSGRVLLTTQEWNDHKAALSTLSTQLEEARLERDEAKFELQRIAGHLLNVKAPTHEDGYRLSIYGSVVALSDRFQSQAAAPSPRSPEGA